MDEVLFLCLLADKVHSSSGLPKHLLVKLQTTLFRRSALLALHVILSKHIIDIVFEHLAESSFFECGETWTGAF